MAWQFIFNMLTGKQIIGKCSTWPAKTDS